MSNITIPSIGQAIVVKMWVGRCHRPGGNSYDGHACGYIFGDDGVGTDGRAVAECDGAENLCAGADHYLIADGRVAFAAFGALPFAAEGDAVIDRAIVADDCSFADDDAHTVIDEQVLTDGRAGMNFNTGEQAACLRPDAGDGFQAYAVEPMRQRIINHHDVEPGVTEDDLQY